MLNRPRPLVLLILDVFGCPVDKEYNAVAYTTCRDFSKVDDAVTDKSFFIGAFLLRAANAAKEKGKLLLGDSFSLIRE